MAETLAQTVGLFAAGLDYVTPDISRPWHEVGGAVIEINQTPGLDMLVAAGADAAGLGAKVLGALPGRIPLSLAVVSASDLPDMLAWLKREAVNPGLGWVCGETAGIGSMPLSMSRLPLWETVATVLRHRTVTQAFVVCTPEMLMRNGMPVDKADEILLGAEALPEAWQLVLNGAGGCTHGSIAEIQARWSSTCAVCEIQIPTF
jgi:cyanophycin synthetase